MRGLELVVVAEAVEVLLGKGQHVLAEHVPDIGLQLSATRVWTDRAHLIGDQIGVGHALPSIVEVVGTDIEVCADSAIRRGADALRALALGARRVLVGRLVLWGLAAGGSGGVERVLRLLQAELAEVMAITGAPSVAQIDRSVLGYPLSVIAW